MSADVAFNVTVARWCVAWRDSQCWCGAVDEVANGNCVRMTYRLMRLWHVVPGLMWQKHVAGDVVIWYYSKARKRFCCWDLNASPVCEYELLLLLLLLLPEELGTTFLIYLTILLLKRFPQAENKNGKYVLRPCVGAVYY